MHVPEVSNSLEFKHIKVATDRAGCRRDDETWEDVFCRHERLTLKGLSTRGVLRGSGTLQTGNDLAQSGGTDAVLLRFHLHRGASKGPCT